MSLSTSSTNAGVPLTMTVTAKTAGGATDTGYRGQVKFTSTDAAFSPGTAFRYTFTAGDAGVHAFSVTFNTAGSAQTITVIDTANAAMTGASPSTNVGETILSATWGAGAVVQGVAVNLTVQAKDSGGVLVTGYRGKVLLAASFGSVTVANWGAGVSPLGPSYVFTATDAGSHTFTPKFTYAGQQTATITDAALSSRTVTTSAITVTNSAPTPGSRTTPAPPG